MSVHSSLTPRKQLAEHPSFFVGLLSVVSCWVWTWFPPFSEIVRRFCPLRIYHHWFRLPPDSGGTSSLEAKTLQWELECGVFSWARGDLTPSICQGLLNILVGGARRMAAVNRDTEATQGQSKKIIFIAGSCPKSIDCYNYRVIFYYVWSSRTRESTKTILELSHKNNRVHIYVQYVKVFTIKIVKFNPTCYTSGAWNLEIKCLYFCQ